VGFEPTTSAHSILVPSAVNGKKLVQIPPAPFIFACRKNSVPSSESFEN
jgi:hypothetical protein